MQHTNMIKNLSGEIFPLFSSSKLVEERNGNDVLELTIFPNKVNKVFINELSEYWRVLHNNIEYRILKLKKITKGNTFYFEVTALPLFYDDMQKTRMYATYNGSVTGIDYFKRIENALLKEYPNDAEKHYKFILLDNVYASEFENLGKGEDLLSIFQKGLERYKLEFEVIGNQIYLKKQIGRDVQFQLRYKLNANNVVQEIDATNLWTYARGFGDLPEDYKDFEKEAKLKKEYVSPLEKIEGIRRHHAPPIVDGRVKDGELLYDNLKELVDNSLKISITANFLDLRKQGYPYAQPKKGDRINLIDERIGLNTYIRVNTIDTQKDALGNVRNINMTFGSATARERHQSNISAGISVINEIMAGRTQIPNAALDNQTQLATQLLLNANTQLEFTDNGIIAKDPKNPNLLVIFNSAGVGISNNGGETFGNAITGAGINASYITTGKMSANFIEGGLLTSQTNSMIWDLNGNDFHFFGNSNISFHSPGNFLRFENGNNAAYLNFTLTQGTDVPAIVLGANRDLTYDPNAPTFTGIVVHSYLDQISLVGDTIYFQNSVTGYNNGNWVMTTFGTGSDNRYFYGADTAQGIKYYLGSKTNFFETIYTKRVQELKFIKYVNNTTGIMDESENNGILIGGQEIFFQLNKKMVKLRDILNKLGYSF